MVECPICNRKLKREKRSLHLKINPEIIIRDVKMHFCRNCGFESIPMEECRLVEKKVNNFSKSKDALIITKIHSA